VSGAADAIESGFASLGSEGRRKEGGSGKSRQGGFPAVRERAAWSRRDHAASKVGQAAKRPSLPPKGAVIEPVETTLQLAFIRGFGASSHAASSSAMIV